MSILDNRLIEADETIDELRKTLADAQEHIERLQEENEVLRNAPPPGWSAVEYEEIKCSCGEPICDAVLVVEDDFIELWGTYWRFPEGYALFKRTD